MSKRIVQILEPAARVRKTGPRYWYVFTPDRELGDAASTPQEAWHQASAFLRGEHYGKWSEAARAPKTPQPRCPDCHHETWLIKDGLCEGMVFEADGSARDCRCAWQPNVALQD